MKQSILYCLLAAWLLVSCGENKDAFVIEGTLNNLGGRPLYAIYPIKDRIVTDTLRPDDGRIAMQGFAEEPVPVQLYDSQMQPVMRFYLQNGDRIELKGNAQKPEEIRMKGNGLNSDLWRLIHDHYDIFATLASERAKSAGRWQKPPSLIEAEERADSLLIAAIEKNRGSQLGSILLADYLLRSDKYALCDSLWNTLDRNAALPYIAANMQELMQRYDIANENKRLPHLRFLDLNDTISFVNPRDSKATLLYIWAAEDPRSASMRHQLSQYLQTYDSKKIQVVALSIDRDTAVWHKQVENDSLPVIHLWCEGAYNNRILKRHHIDRLPVVMLGDSLGMIVVRASALPDPDIEAQTDSLLNIAAYQVEQPIIKP